jgi:hypothetical protein
VLRHLVVTVAKYLEIDALQVRLMVGKVHIEFQYGEHFPFFSFDFFSVA